MSLVQSAVNGCLPRKDAAWKIVAGPVIGGRKIFITGYPPEHVSKNADFFFSEGFVKKISKP